MDYRYQYIIWDCGETGKCLKPFLKSYMRVFLFFGIFLILIHAIFHDEGAVLFTIIHITFKEEGLRRGIFMSAIILTIAGGMILFHQVTRLDDVMMILAVSYTHLDVYKRQVQCGAIRCDFKLYGRESRKQPGGKYID